MAIHHKTQKQRCQAKHPTKISHGIEVANFQNCIIYNPYDVTDFLKGASRVLKNHLGSVDFIANKSDAESNIANTAEFIVWYLLHDVLQCFKKQNSTNGQNYMWVNKGSPNFIDIRFVYKRNDGKWYFSVVEIKWSEKCNYGQVTSGLYEDIRKLYYSQYSGDRLTSHISGFKQALSHTYWEKPEIIDEIFRDIEAGTDASGVKNIEFWGVFVSDWLVNPHQDADASFGTFISKATRDGWKLDLLKGLMLNIEDGKNHLINLSMGRSK